MKPILACLAALLFATTAQAQTGVQPIKLQPMQSQTAAQAAQVDQTALEKARLERENKRLREENEALKRQVSEMTSLGGSQVRAYCATPTTSANTAGASADCAASGYGCDVVTGLCKTRCETSNDCGGGSNCDVRSGRCIFGEAPEQADCTR